MLKLKRSLKALHTALRDFAYGIDAGNAIRHGLTPPARHRAHRSPVGRPHVK